MSLISSSIHPIASGIKLEHRSSSATTMQQAVIFDMDGVIIDSEPLWQAAEKTVFATIDITLTTAMCRQTIGLRTDEVIRYWFDRQPWESKSLDQVESELLAEVETLILAQGESMAGLSAMLDQIQASDLRLAIASSSPKKLIQSVMTKLTIGDYFESFYSGFDVPNGKPDPAVYFAAATGLGLAPENCLAIEDSLAGIRSAKAAGMKVIAVPEPASYDNEKFNIADLKVRSLVELDLDMIRSTLNQS
jgi:mannitol-1-/sugar-/sorbitol-6-/2-deoxyglucose-6-phosphatase